MTKISYPAVFLLDDSGCRAEFPDLPAFPSPSLTEDIIMPVTYDSLEYARMHRTKALKNCTDSQKKLPALG